MCSRPHLKSPRLLRKAVKPSRRTSAATVVVAGGSHAVTKRVRDGLVLRAVVNQAEARNQTDEHGAR